MSKNMMGQIPIEKEFHGLCAIRSVCFRLLHMLARNFPMYPHWRVVLHKIRGVKVGNNVFIGSEVFIDNTYPESIIIEDFVTIISRTFIIGHSFSPNHLRHVIHSDGDICKGVQLKKGCYVGAQCILMPGVIIGECAIVGAGSVVIEDVPPYSVAMGAPARVVRRFDRNDVNWCEVETQGRV